MMRIEIMEKVRECHPDRHTEAESGHQERMETRMKEVQKGRKSKSLNSLSLGDLGLFCSLRPEKPIRV